MSTRHTPAAPPPHRARRAPTRAVRALVAALGAALAGAAGAAGSARAQPPLLPPAAPGAPLAVPAANVAPAAPAPTERPAAPAAAGVFSGRAGRLDVGIPRVDTTIAIDGTLDAPVWGRAAELTGFTTFNPVDGRPALDSTDVRVWYSSTAIYFGIRAFAPPGTVRATLADRDRITGDDHVSILLDTFDDRRRAFLFAVNPLGIQLDGMRSETGGGGGPGQSRAGVQQADLSQDFIWESKGRVVADGFVVTIRVPFKSLRFRPGAVQDWGIQIVRQTQRTGYQDTWAPASRGNASFLVQRGRLRGLRGLERGLVLDLTPVATSLTDGRAGPNGGWGYVTRPQWGADARWGVTPNLTGNATVNPDFSQVEADVGQIPGDIRFALFFPELRPFFVEGSEQLDTPSRLVYTRTIVRPEGAAKLTGKVGQGDLGVLAAVDDPVASSDGRTRPLFLVTRYRRDLGAQSNAAFTYTDRTEGATSNRVVSADSRIFFGRVYSWNGQVAWSATRDASGQLRMAPLFETNLGRTGRLYGFRYEVTGIAPGFETRTGFVPRTDFARVQLNNRFSWFGRRGAWLEQWSGYVTTQGLWTYRGAFAAEGPLESRVSLNNIFTLRGGWSVSMNPIAERFAFDPSRYADLRIVRPRPDAPSGPGVRVPLDTLPFAPGAAVGTFGVQTRLATPQYQRWAGSLQLLAGRDVDFLETAPARRVDVDASLDLRPTSQVRVNALLRRSAFARDRDGSRLLATTIPRLRLEYQMTRWVFFRFVGQYESRTRDALVDPITGQSIQRASGGTLTPLAATASNRMRVDWLFSFLPSPGRVVFVGYGSSLEDRDAFRLRDVTRTGDGLFVKASWLWRAGQGSPTR